MMEFIYFFILVFSLTFLYFNNPLILIISLILNSLTISLLFFIFSLTPWFSFILILIYLGGMLVLFAYISNIASNEFNLYPIYIMFLSSLTAILFVSFINNMNQEYFYHLNDKKEFIFYHLNDKNMKISLMYNDKNSKIIFLLISFLLIILLVIMKIINMNEGPLRLK